MPDYVSSDLGSGTTSVPLTEGSPQTNPNIALAGQNALTQSQQNPLATLGQFAGIQNQLNQNTLFQRQLQANTLLGQYAQQSIDPQSGQLDLDKFQNLSLSNPLTAAYGATAVNNIRQGQLFKLQAGGEQYNQSTKALGQLQLDLASAKTPDMLPAMLQARAGTLPEYLRPGFMSAANGLIDALKAPQGNGQLVDQATYDQRRSVLAGEGNMSAEAQRQAFGITGTQLRGLPGGGQATVGTLQDAATGALTAKGGMIPQGMSASDAASPAFSQALPGGATAPVLKGSYVGSGGLLTGGTGAQAAPQSGAALPQGYSSGGSIVPPGKPLTQLPSAWDNFYKGTGPIAEQKNEIDNTLTSANQLEPQLNRLLELSNLTPTGGGTNFRNHIGQLAQAFGADEATTDKIQSLLKTGNDNDAFAAAQELRKYAIQANTGVLRQFLTGLGKMTNLEFKTIQDNFLSPDTDPKAFNNITKFMLGAIQLTRQQQQFYQNGINLGPQKYDINNLATDWQKNAQEQGYGNMKTLLGQMGLKYDQGGAGGNWTRVGGKLVRDQ